MFELKKKQGTQAIIKYKNIRCQELKNPEKLP